MLGIQELLARRLWRWRRWRRWRHLRRLFSFYLW